MFTKEFWLAAAERAVKTFAQTFGALIVGNAIGIVGFDWLAALNVAGMAAVASVVTSVGSSKVGAPGPSVAGETLTAEVAAVDKAWAEYHGAYAAGPAADVPEGTPVTVEPVTYSGDTKADAAYHGLHEGQ